MKKLFLLMSAILMSAVSVNAVDWHYVDTDIPNLNLFIDKDSIKPLNSQECIYAIKFSSNTKPEKVAYIKSNFAKKTIGVIQVGDYTEDTYRPRVVFANYHVFMKELQEDSLLSFATNYAHNTVIAGTQSVQEKTAFTPEQVPQEEQISESVNIVEKFPNIEQSEDNIKPVGYTVYTTNQKDCAVNTVEEYVTCVSQDLYKLWTPPKSGRHSQAIVIVQLASDGSLLNYKFAKKSGDEATDRSIMSAIEQNVLYPKFPASEKSSEILNVQFVFEYKLFKKAVM